MGDEQNMPIQQKKSLKLECERQRESAMSCPNNDEPFAIGAVDDFKETELLEPPKHCSIFIAYNKVYSIKCPNPPHYTGEGVIADTIADALRRQCGDRKLVRALGPFDIAVTNFNECHKTFTRQPDRGIFLRQKNGMLFSEPAIAIEVAFSNEPLDLLLREGEVLLNQATTIQYALLVKIYANDERVTRIRTILCARLSVEELKRAQKPFAATRKADCSANFAGTRHTPWELERMSGSELEADYNVRILFDETVLRNNVHDIVLPFSGALLLQRASLADRFHDDFTVTIPRDDLLDIFNSPLSNRQ